MAKTKISNPAFQKSENQPKQEFNLVAQANPFNSIFDTQVLDEKTTHAIEQLLHDMSSPDVQNFEQLQKDLYLLKNITVEVKAIEKQGVLLIGERLFKAREILGRWGKGADSFKSWLNIVFKHRSTAYNILAYYDLYKTLPNTDLQKKLKEMPHKAAYVLAARKGHIEEKAEIVEQHFQLKADEIIAIVQNKFPSDKKEKKASVPDVLIDSIRISLRKLISRKGALKKGHFTAISECMNLLGVLLQTNPETQPSIEISCK